MTELFEKAQKMTKEEIATLIVDNDLVEDVYDILHYIIMAKLGNLQRDLTKASIDLRLVRKFADADNFDGVKLVLVEDGDKK